MSGSDRRALPEVFSLFPGVVAYVSSGQQAMLLSSRLHAPLLPDWRDFGRLVVSGALSGIYAAGGCPLHATLTVVQPAGVDPDAIQQMLSAAESVCRQAGLRVDHGLAQPGNELLFSVQVMGTISAAHLKRQQVRRGDVLLLVKPLGAGAYRTAMQHGRLAPADYQQLLEHELRPNAAGALLGCLDGVHAMLPVAERGLAGALESLCVSAGLGAQIVFSQIPKLEQAGALLAAPPPGEDAAMLDAPFQLASHLGALERSLLLDAQVVGGLLIACAPDTTTEVLSILLQQGCGQVSVIGELVAGSSIALH